MRAGGTNPWWYLCQRSYPPCGKRRLITSVYLHTAYTIWQPGQAINLACRQCYGAKVILHGCCNLFYVVRLRGCTKELPVLAVVAECFYHFISTVSVCVCSLARALLACWLACLLAELLDCMLYLLAFVFLGCLLACLFEAVHVLHWRALGSHTSRLWLMGSSNVLASELLHKLLTALRAVACLRKHQRPLPVFQPAVPVSAVHCRPETSRGEAVAVTALPTLPNHVRKSPSGQVAGSSGVDNCRKAAAATSHSLRLIGWSSSSFGM